mgnify:FL=1
MKKGKKLLTLALVVTAPLITISSFVINDSNVEIFAEDALVSGDIITNNQSNWTDSTNATFTENSMKAVSGNFNWQTQKISGNSKVDFLVDQTLELSPMADWKWEYLTFSTSNEKGIDAGTGITTASNSLSLVWGWGKGFSVIEKDSTGKAVFDKALSLDDSGVKVTGLEKYGADQANILNESHFYCFNKSSRIITQMTEITNGVKFDFELITKSPWGHDIDITFSYTSTNEQLKGDKHVTYGRTGSGTIDENHNIIMTMGIVDPTIYSASKDNWSACDNAIFTGNVMKATGPTFNYQTKEIGGNSKVDFTSNQSLELSPMADWKWEYLTFANDTTFGIDATTGMVQANNSVSLVWGWTKGFAVIERDANGTVIFDKSLGYTEGTNIVPDNFPDDPNIMNQFHYYCFDKAFRIVTQMTETASGVKFDFELITKSPWGHEIDATFSYTSTNASLKGNTKHVTYGRTGSGTIDENHNIEVTMKVNNIEAVDVPIIPTTKYECKLDNGYTFEKIEANEGFAHSFASSLNLLEGQEFNVNFLVDDEKSAHGYDAVKSFVDNSTNEVKYQGSFYEKGNDGKIKINVNGTYKVIVNVKENNEVEINLEVLSYSLIDVANKYHSDANYWKTLYNAAINDGTMSQTGIQSLGITKEFNGNATVKFVLDYTALDSSWGGVVLMVKGQAEEFSKVLWTFNNTTNTIVPSNANGSFIALCITHAGYQLIVCDEGNINVIGTDQTFLIPGVDGNSFWFICQQKTEVTFDVLDVTDGVKLNISYYASRKGETYSNEILLPYKSLWGNQSAGLALTASGNTPDLTNNTISLYVADSKSSYSKDLYYANKFIDELTKINYDTITADNYSDIVNQFNNVTNLYNNLTDTQKELVSSEDINKYNQIKSDLENVDVVVLAKLALEKLNEVNEAYNRVNYERQAKIVKDASAKYELLTDEQKSQCDATLVKKLEECKKALNKYEDILSYADPVVALIAKINLPITNYAKDSRTILAAKKAYDELYDIEKSEVTNVDLLEQSLIALKEYEDANKIDGYNFAQTKDNIYELDGFDDMQAKDGSLIVNSSTNDLSIYTTAKALNEMEFTWIIDSNLQKCTWGNFYFIVRADSIAKHHNKGSWLQEGNYMVLLVGGDGFKIVECVNGVIPMTKDAAGNPLADFKTILDYPTDEEGSQLDIHHIYKNYTKISIKTIDLYENDEYVGYKAIISLTGGESGKTFVREYISTNKDSKDCGYFGLEAFVSDPINQGSGGFEIKGIYIEGVTSYDGAKVKNDIKNKQIAKECDALLEQVITNVNKGNLESAKSAYEMAKNAYDALTDEQKSLLTKDANVLNEAKLAIDKVIKDSEEKPSEKPSEEPSSTPTEITSSSEIINSSTNNTSSNEEKPNENKKGCKGEASTSLGLIALLGSLLLKKKKQ